MSPRTGRPPAKHPKDKNFTVRLDQETFEKLEQYCKKNNIAKGAAVRQAIVLMLFEG